MALERGTHQPATARAEPTPEEELKRTRLDDHPERCHPQEILAEVVVTQVSEEGIASRVVRTAGHVREVDSCEAHLVQARVDVGEHAWDVTALFRIVLRLDTGHGDRIIRTMGFFRTAIPFPEYHEKASDLDDLKARVDVSMLECSTVIDEDHDSVQANLTFKVTVSALESRIITVCRLHHHPE